MRRTQTIQMTKYWLFDDIPSVRACGVNFTVDHAMICKRGGFAIQRHSELRDLEADLLSTVCSDVEVEPVLQHITDEQLKRVQQSTRRKIGHSGAWLLGSSGLGILRYEG